MLENLDAFLAGRPEVAGSFLPGVMQSYAGHGGGVYALPYRLDTQLLFYRRDLFENLEKYGYAEAPKTWAEVQAMCEKVQAGERAAGNANFWGFVFPGAATDAFANDVLEWTAGNDGGDWVDAEGNVTVNNGNAREILELITGWYGKIVPEGVTAYNNDEARGFFQSGNALFMRNWPYAYALGQSADSPIKDKVSISAIPHGESIAAAVHVVASQAPDVCPQVENLEKFNIGWQHFLKDPVRCVDGFITPDTRPGLVWCWTRAK